MSFHNGVNLVGDVSYFDLLIVQDNVMNDCGGMMAVNNQYFGGFDDFYPVWGMPISSTMDAEYRVQVQNNTFTGNSARRWELCGRDRLDECTWGRNLLQR